MPKVKIDLGIKDYVNDIDVNLLELNGKKEITEAIQTWESLHDQKIGPLHKIVADTNVGDWEKAKIEIIGKIDKKSKTNKAVCILHCRWTNYFQVIDLEESGQEDNMKVFRNQIDINRENFSSKLVIKIKFLNELLTEGVSQEFNIQTDTREGVEIGDSLFDWERVNFETQEDSEKENWYPLLKDLNAFKNLSSVDFPHDDSGKTKIYINLDFPGVDSLLQEDNVEKDQVLNQFLLYTMTQGPFMSICNYITLLLNEYKPEKRRDIDDIEGAAIGEEIISDFEERSLIVNIETIHFISSLIFPKEMKDPSLRIYNWWKNSNAENILSLSPNFVVAFQRWQEIEKNLNNLADLVQIVEVETEEDEGEAI